ncbi:MAG TPA: insulinase family protein [Thermoflexales bacterium]|nr:insulinase family protein [Thermoflexales bacterium]HQW35949.1 insulinase family protein [Thermoflexales bacterium]
MTLSHGFELIEERNIPEINTRARWYRHAKTGAELLSLMNDDENKMFGISFATPPQDSTGVAHILEHSVLCGSRKYPLKEPFVELIKGSLKTFVNAFTFPDKTCYPVASQNVKDFYNLMDVYLDAVFYPNITPWTLMQEGWHYELEDKDAPMIYKGVVFNEMKGAYSSPEGVLGRTIQQTLLPDTTYGVDSGGDPEVIPSLTYENFKRFHETFYHPSNAKIVMYGDDDPEQRLRYLDGWLSGFDKIEVKPNMALQPRWAAPRRVEEKYDAGDDPDAKSFVSVNWLLTDESDPETLLGLDILAHMLAGTPASPLRKALIDSGLGEDVIGGGMENDLRENSYSIGMKGVTAENADKVEALILDTLHHLAHTGFEPDQVAASLNTIEFRLREANFGGYPRGIVYMIAALQTWLYGGDPFTPLAFEKPLAAVKARLNNHENVFAGLLQKYFVNNTHRSTVVMRPDAQVRAEADARERARLDAARAAMSEADIARVIEQTHTLQKMQNTPDSPEALATIPSLTLGDLDKTAKNIPVDVAQAGEATILHHDLFTNGIAYLDVAFDLRALPAALLPYAGLFGNALLEMGTDKEDFAALSRRIGRETGGIYATAINTATRAHRDTISRFVLRGKSTAAQFPALLGILGDVLSGAKLDNRERFRQIVLEEKAGAESGLIPSGHSYVASRLGAFLGQPGWASEQTGGVDYLFFLRALADRVEKDWDGVLADLRAVQSHLISPRGLVANITVDGASYGAMKPQIEGFLKALRARPNKFGRAPGALAGDWPAHSPRVNEGLTIPAQVNYVGKAADVYAAGFKLHGSWLAVQNWLRTTYLWERVRVQGGAYGAFCSFDQRTGGLSFLSYRDPNLGGTLANYDGVGAFIRSHAPSASEIERVIIGVIGQLDAYQLPDAKGYTSMVRHLAGDTDAQRQHLREEALSTTREDFARFADVADVVMREGVVSVIGSAQAIEKAGGLSVTKIL